MAREFPGRLTGPVLQGEVNQPSRTGETVTGVCSVSWQFSVKVQSTWIRFVMCVGPLEWPPFF